MRDAVQTARRAFVLALAVALAAFGSTPSRASTETVVHAFDSSGLEGGYTLTGLIKVGSKFYGTTSTGGANGWGTIYSMTPGGTLTVLYSFQGGNDGGYPRAGLTNVHGVLYGTTVLQGTGINCPYFASCGTVFQYDPSSGIETVVYSFQGGSDGSNPFGGLIYDGGDTLYGTTEQGGDAANCPTTYISCGTVYSLTLAGVETVLYAFHGNHDGANPFSGLILSNGKLFGTTTQGGTTCPDLPHGCGTVFRLTPPAMPGGVWVEHVLYRFQGGTDGADPFDALVKFNGSFYGTTFYGGASHAGIVFAVSPSGTETIVHSFLDGTDGSHSNASLTDVGGILYGTTSAGGTSGCGYYYPQFDGCGTIFKVVPGGIQTLYSFMDGNDGGNPYAGALLKVGSDLYGTTFGAGAGGLGTIYKFTP